MVIRIKDLPLNNAPNPNQFLATDLSAAEKMTIQTAVDTGAPVASEAEAVAGTNATKRMTPLTVKQAIDARGSSSPSVATRTALKAITDLTAGRLVYLTEGDRFGPFTAVAGSPPHADPAEGVYIVSDTPGWYWEREYDGEISASWYGATGDGVTNDTASLQAFAASFDLFRSVGPIQGVIPAKRYLITATITFFEDPTSGNYRSTLNWHSAEFIWDVTRVGKQYAITLGDPDDPIEGNSTLDVRGRVMFNKGPNCTDAPIAVYAGVIGQSALDGVNVGASWNNIAVHLQGVQNVTFSDYIIYSGGRSFLYQDTSGSLFRQTGSDLDRVSGTYSFPTSCVGKVIEIGDDRKATIVSRTSATKVVLDNTVTDSTDQTVQFGSPAVTTVLGSPNVVLDGPVTSDMVGLIVGIPRAGTNGKILWAEVTAANAGTSTLTLNRNAAVNLNPVADPTQTTEIAVPVIFLDSFKTSDGGVFSNGISQARFYNLQIETFRGVAIGVDDAESVHFIGAKLHGNSSPSASVYALAAIWANRLNGTYLGEFDQRMVGRQRLFTADNTRGFEFLSLTARLRRYEKLIRANPYASGFEGGVISFRTLFTSGLDSAATFSTIAEDTNPTATPGIVPPDRFIDGEIGPVGFNISPVPWTPQVADAATGGNVAAVGSSAGTVYRRNGFVHVTVRITNINTAGLTAGNNLYIRNLPQALRGGTQNLVTSSIRYSGISGAAPTAFGDDGDDYFLLYPANSTTPVIVSAVTSGTNTVILSAMYTT